LLAGPGRIHASTRRSGLARVAVRLAVTAADWIVQSDAPFRARLAGRFGIGGSTVLPFCVGTVFVCSAGVTGPGATRLELRAGSRRTRPEATVAGAGVAAIVFRVAIGARVLALDECIEETFGTGATTAAENRPAAVFHALVWPEAFHLLAVGTAIGRGARRAPTAGGIPR